METPATHTNSRTPPRRRRVPWMLVAALVLVAGIGGSLWCLHRYETRFRNRVFTEDAVHVIAGEVCNSLQGGEEMSDAEITEMILHLHRASVINIRLDAAGRPTDYYGNPFQVTYERTGGRVTVTCLSPGRDGKAGSPDDIVKTVGVP